MDSAAQTWTSLLEEPTKPTSLDEGTFQQPSSAVEKCISTAHPTHLRRTAHAYCQLPTPGLPAVSAGTYHLVFSYNRTEGVEFVLRSLVVTGEGSGGASECVPCPTGMFCPGPLPPTLVWWRFLFRLRGMEL